jgi:hypothetical protein
MLSLDTAKNCPLDQWIAETLLSVDRNARRLSFSRPERMAIY